MLNMPVKEQAKMGLAHTIALSGARDGVGCTSIAVNLAIALAKLNKRTLLVDASEKTINTSYLLGLNTTDRVKEQIETQPECLHQALTGVINGLDLMPNGIALYDALMASNEKKSALASSLQIIDQSFEFLLVDTSSQNIEKNRHFIDACQSLVMVITPDEFNLLESLKTLQTYAEFGVLPQVLVLANKVQSISQAKEIFQKFSLLVKRELKITIGFGGFVPSDESIRSAIMLQHPVALFDDADPSAQRFHRLANTIMDVVLPNTVNKPFSYYWAPQAEKEKLQSLFKEQVKQDIDDTETTDVDVIESESVSHQEYIVESDALRSRKNIEPDTALSLHQLLSNNESGLQVADILAYIEQGYFSREQLASIADISANVYVEQYGKNPINLDRYVNQLFNQGGSLERQMLRDLYVMLHSRFAEYTELEPIPTPRSHVVQQELALNNMDNDNHQLKDCHNMVSDYHSQSELAATLKQLRETDGSLLDWLNQD